MYFLSPEIIGVRLFYIQDLYTQTKNKKPKQQQRKNHIQDSKLTESSLINWRDMHHFDHNESGQHEKHDAVLIERF